MATRVDLVIDQGASFEIVFNVVDANSSVIDISDYDSAAQMRPYYESNDSVDFTTAISNTNAITLTMDPDTTANLEPGRWVYDCVITSTSNAVTRVMEGLVSVNPATTR